MDIRNTFPKNERLHRRDEIQEVFSRGQGVFSFPLKLVFCPQPKMLAETACKAAFSVSKKRHRKAVARNRIKRRLREAYRKHKVGFAAQLPKDQNIMMMFIYVSDEIMAFADIEKAVIECLSKCSRLINKS